MKKFHKIGLICSMTAILTIAALETTEYSARQMFLDSLRSHGYTGVHIKRGMLYLDGFVARDVQLDEHIHLDTLYVQGNPLRLLFSTPVSVWVDKAVVDTNGLFDKDILWPIPKGCNFSIDALQISSRFWQQSLKFEGSLKQDNDQRAVFSIASDNDILKGDGQGEILFQEGKIKTVNFELDSENFHLMPLEAWRLIAWFVLTREKEWSITGEANAGSMEAGPLSFLDSSLKIGGLMTDPVISFSGVNKKSGQTWVIDGQKNTINLQREDDEDKVDLALADKTQVENWLLNLKDDPIAVQESKTTIKTKAVKPKTETALSSSLPTVPADPVRFEALVAGSFFEGFHYTKILARIKTDCQNKDETGCWSAHGIGGSLSYDPSVMPAYLQRMKNYDQAVLLRHVMQNIAVDLLRIDGRDGKINHIVIKGKSGAQPVYLDLSVDDVE